MKKGLTEFFVSIFLSLAALAVVISTVVPVSAGSEFSQLTNFETDTEGESETESEKAEDEKEKVAKRITTIELEDLFDGNKLSHFEPNMGDVHLDVFTPPPEC